MGAFEWPLRIAGSNSERAVAVKWAMGEADRVAYQRFPEQPDDFWDDAQVWVAE